MKSPEFGIHHKMVFSGQDALINYFNPESHPPIPLVEIPNDLNPYCEDRVRVFGKIMSATPLANVKCLPAYHMLEQALKAGKLANIERIYESSSGNTAFSLTVIARALGIDDVNIFVSSSISPEKLAFLKLLGITVIVNQEPMCPDPEDPESGINKAKNYAMQFQGYCPSQYDNPMNPDAHYRWTGPQIFWQLDGNLQIYAATLGTTGTILGSGRFLKEHLPNLKVVGVASAEDKVRLGPRSKNSLKEIGFPWQEFVDVVVEVEDKEAYELSLKLFQRGFMAGPSSGFNLAGLYRYIEGIKRDGSLDSFRNSSGEIVCVCIFPDGPLPYLNSYQTNVSSELMSKVLNEHLLKSELLKAEILTDRGLYPANVFELLQSDRNVEIWDIRKEIDYERFRIQGAKRIDVELIESMTDEKIGYLTRENIYVIVVDCGLADFSYSGVLASMIFRKGINAFYMIGGMDDWSKAGFPVDRGYFK
ncbi:MAG: pyridoxal-phosphate dependent enzyme [Patescibacteria group bacterium]|nr:pyridoxal-phosphate dependent enzyme [Patescibacteria group bacterium]